MASRMDDLESRVLALTEATNHLHNRLAQAEAFQQEARLQLKELSQAQQGLQQGVLLPMKAQMGFMEGRLDGKKETSTLLITAFLSAVGVLLSALLGLLNLQGRF